MTFKNKSLYKKQKYDANVKYLQRKKFCTYALDQNLENDVFALFDYLFVDNFNLSDSDIYALKNLPKVTKLRKVVRELGKALLVDR